MLIEYVLAMGMAMISSAVTVYIRDLEYILGIVIMAWQFLSPVIYSVDMVPEEFKMIFYFNPIAPVIVAYRDILYYGEVPEFGTLIHATLFGVGLLIFGIMLFGKLKKHFAEEM